MNSTYVRKYDHVYRYLEKNHTTTLTELKVQFSLCDSTARRILSELERSGLVERFHGGARLKLQATFESELAEQAVLMKAQKGEIGREAAGLLANGMTVVMLGGSTVHAVCPYMKGMNLTVITNSLKIAMDLSKEDGIQIIMLGGALKATQLEVYGPLASQNCKSFRSDLVFIGATSVSPDIGCTASDMNAVETYRACMATGRKTVLLATSNKFSPGGYAIVAPCAEIGMLITDWGISEMERLAFEKQGVQVLAAKRSDSVNLTSS